MGCVGVAGLVRTLRFLPPVWLTRREAIANRFVIGGKGLANGAAALRFPGLTVLIWVYEMAMNFILARAFQLPLPVRGALFLLLVVGLGTMAPAAPGSAGTYEFFGTGAQALLGFTWPPALSFTPRMHAA
jgi:uncharacterized membrane protein YbhN (UPF0104 family)